MHSRTWLVLAVVLVMAVPLAAESVSEGLRQDADQYSMDYGVPPEEAVRRLQLQHAVGDLEGKLLAEEGESFAGIWIQHQPVYRVIARFTDRAAEERLQARVASGPLKGLVETRSARFSLADLEKKQKDAHGRSQKAAVRAESRINVIDNKVEVYVADTKKLTDAVRMPEGVEVRHSARPSKPDAAIYGGSAVSSCTAGFGVISANGELGVTTAGHCYDSQAYQFVNLPFRAQLLGGDHDVQWNSACDLFDVNNRVLTGLFSSRAITSTLSRTNQTLGTYLCKYGKTSGYTCGTIVDKNVQPEPGFNYTFIRVSGAARAGGDSGGPWFADSVAYGTHWGGWQDLTNESLYMAVNYIGGLNVSVLTSVPGICNILPTALYTFTRTAPVTTYTYTFNGSSSSDSDGSIALYTWDVDGDVFASSSSPTASMTLPLGNPVYVTLTVTDNEGKTNYATKAFKTCGIPGQPCP